MSQLQNCSVMCTKNGSYCENEKREKKSGVGGCVQRMEVIVKRGKKSGWGRVQGRCERRSEAFVKIQKKKLRGRGGLGGRGSGGPIRGWGGGGG